MTLNERDKKQKILLRSYQENPSYDSTNLTYKQVENYFEDNSYRLYGFKFCQRYYYSNKLPLRIDCKLKNLFKKYYSTIDFICIKNGKFAFVEVKSGKSELQFKQIVYMKQLINMGYDCYIFYKKDMCSSNCLIKLNKIILSKNFSPVKIRHRILNKIGYDNWDFKNKQAYIPDEITSKTILNEIKDSERRIQFHINKIKLLKINLEKIKEEEFDKKEGWC